MRKTPENTSNDNNDNDDSSSNMGMLDSIMAAGKEAQRPKGMLDSIASITDAAERQRQEEAARPKGMIDSIVATTEAARSGQATGNTDTGVRDQSAGISSSSGGYSPGNADMSATSDSTGTWYPPYNPDEEFVGSGGVGSAEQMEAMRKGREERGIEFNSDMRSADEIDHG